MSDLDYGYEEIEESYLKNEPVENDGPETLDNCEEESGKTVIHETQAKCGDIFVGWQGDFTLVCSVCREEFKTLYLFCLHVKERHLVLKSTQELPKKNDSALTKRGAAKGPPPSSRANAGGKNPSKDKQFSRSQSEADAKTSNLAINSLQANQTDKNSEVKEISDIWEPDEKSSSDEYNPEEDASSKNENLPEKKEYFCIYCCRTYKTEKYFLAHRKKEHNVDNPVEEDGCVESSEPVKMVCKYCDKCFEDQIEFKNHVNAHTGPNRFVCPLCPKAFACRYSRKLHVNTHTGERPFKCTHCPKAFSDGRNLQPHIRMHLGIMKYKCDYCDKRFVQSTEKKHHERIHTGEKPYQCEECGKQFLSYARLAEHGLRHKNIKNHKCEVCSKAFYTTALLKDHMRAHTGERPFECNICCQTFSRRKALVAHLKLHSAEKAYVCDLCGKAFAQFSGLYSHRKSHRGDKSK